MTWITLVEGIAIGLMIYMLLQTLRRMPGAQRSSLLTALLLAVLGPVPIVALVCLLRSYGGQPCSTEALVAFWAVLAATSAGVGLLAGGRASSH
ncbi:MAG TPA: hypothetical protein VKA55_02530 [Gammaproteobacteria bacterium]|nr:hypothetical protein [Gammaproteobacteria bacterium]